jgi:hypothetical protein
MTSEVVSVLDRWSSGNLRWEIGKDRERLGEEISRDMRFFGTLSHRAVLGESPELIWTLQGSQWCVCVCVCV